MLEKNNVTLPQNLAKTWSEDQIKAMAEVAYNLPHMWNHAIGTDWKNTITLELIENLYKRL